jgi:hypothetical protein
MLSDNATVLLAGIDSDLLVLRSAVLATVGIWSLRVRTTEQARQVIGMVPFEMAILCYTWDEVDQQRLIGILAEHAPNVRTLQLKPGDDCSATNFLRKVRETLAAPASGMHAILELSPRITRMVR